MSKKTEAIRRELERIAKANGGVLYPEKVVEAARPSTSPLHSRFEWDDSEAACQYRIWQARQLISITVNVISQTGDEERMWVSLKPDREMGGGYRSMISVLSDSEMRNQLLQDAYKDMEAFEQKYRHLQELVAVFAAMNHTRRRRKAA